MTKDDAKEIKKAAWAYGNAMYDCGAGNLDIAKAEKIWRAFETLIDSMIGTKIADNDSTQPTYITRCPACHAKIEWVEFEVTAKTPAEIAAENALCNAAYLAKKPELP